MPSRRDATALFIDASSLHAAKTAVGIEIDFKRLLSEFESNNGPPMAFYYALESNDPNHSSGRSLRSWLSQNGYTVIAKPVKESTDSSDHRKLSGAIGVDLAVNAMQLAEQLGHMILLSGDGDFKPLVRAMQRRGVRVTVVSTTLGEPSLIADRLRRQADVFVDLKDLMSRIGLHPTTRAAPSDRSTQGSPARRKPEVVTVPRRRRDWPS